MTSPYPLDQGSASPVAAWYEHSSTCSRSYLIAAARAAVISAVLLGILVLVVVF